MTKRELAEKIYTFSNPNWKSDRLLLIHEIEIKKIMRFHKDILQHYYDLHVRCFTEE